MYNNPPCWDATKTASTDSALQKFNAHPTTNNDKINLHSTPRASASIAPQRQPPADHQAFKAAAALSPITSVTTPDKKKQDSALNDNQDTSQLDYMGPPSQDTNKDDSPPLLSQPTPGQRSPKPSPLPGISRGAGGRPVITTPGGHTLTPADALKHLGPINLHQSLHPPKHNAYQLTDAKPTDQQTSPTAKDAPYTAINKQSRDHMDDKSPANYRQMAADILLTSTLDDKVLFEDTDASSSHHDDDEPPSHPPTYDPHKMYPYVDVPQT